MEANAQSNASHAIKRRLHAIIFEADTPAGRVFDITLLILIIASVVAVMLESMAGVRQDWGELLYLAEWVFTILFTIEYILRISVVERKSGYLLSFYGIVDLISILPTYLSASIAGAQTLIIVRVLRVLRIFRVFKLTRFTGESKVLWRAIKASMPKITVFLLTVVTIVLIIGSLMFLIEGPENGFSSIPTGVYWAIVTMTTVGFGDITPATPLGKMLASVVMILGYGIIAVPTGIVSVELANTSKKVSTQVCTHCANEDNDVDARHCKVCGKRL